MMGDTFTGRLGLQQRVLPSYRAVFLDALATACQEGLSVFAGEPLLVEGIDSLVRLEVAQYAKAKNRYFRDPNSALFICWQAGFIHWLETWQPEVLIVEANPRYLSTLGAIRWMHAQQRKVIGWGLGAPPITGPLSGLRILERASMLRSLDAIIAYSSQGAEQYRNLGFPKERVFVALNAVNPAPVSPPPRYEKVAKEATILFVGRLQARKRVDLLLRACASLPEVLQPHLTIVGDGPARGAFEALAAQVYPNAEFVGARHGAELEPYFAKADLFVLPGTGGLAIQQAMAHGLPVVVARGDGTQDDLVRTQNGWQVEPDNLPALTDVLQTALSDLTMLRRMGEASYRIVATEVNIEAMVGVFIRAVNDLCRA